MANTFAPPGVIAVSALSFLPRSGTRISLLEWARLAQEGRCHCLQLGSRYARNEQRAEGQMSAADTLPYYLRGNFAPVMQEITALDLPVKGAIPPELCGRFVRNGPNPKTGFSPHPFAGDGMLHGVALKDGRALWYKNRWVRTRSFTEDGNFIRADGTRDVSVGKANTHIVAHAGRIFALVETSLPMQVTNELDTIGCFDFDGRLETGMTAHPKVCPQTGELHFFAYNWQGRPPWLISYRADLKRSFEAERNHRRARTHADA
jgi:carotenoid cleavage dioxygenase